MAVDPGEQSATISTTCDIFVPKTNLSINSKCKSEISGSFECDGTGNNSQIQIDNLLEKTIQTVQLTIESSQKYTCAMIDVTINTTGTSNQIKYKYRFFFKGIVNHLAPGWFNLNDTAGDTNFTVACSCLIEKENISLQTDCDGGPYKPGSYSFSQQYHPNYKYAINASSTCGGTSIQSDIVYSTHPSDTVPNVMTNFKIINDNQLQCIGATDAFATLPIRFVALFVDLQCNSSFVSCSDPYFNERLDNCTVQANTLFTIPIPSLTAATNFTASIFLCRSDISNECKNDSTIDFAQCFLTQENIPYASKDGSINQIIKSTCIVVICRFRSGQPYKCSHWIFYYLL